VAQIGAGRLIVPIVAGEHPWVSRDHLTKTIAVRIINADLDVADRRADGVEVDVIDSMRAINPDHFRLAVNLAQGNADRAKKLKDIGTEWGAACRCRADARKAKAVAQGASNESI